MKKKTPYISYAMMAACTAVCILVHVLDAGNTSESAIFLGAFYKPLVYAGEWWRLLTVAFVHVSPLHLFVNMYSLNIMGRSVELSLGHKKFAMIFFGSVIGGSLFILAMSGNDVTVGCSAGLYGLMAAYIYMITAAGGMKVPQVRNSVLMMVLVNVLVNMMPNVSAAGHMGGAMTGILIVLACDQLQTKSMHMNALAALIILIAGMSLYCAKNTYISRDERYLGTDFNILKRYYDLGFQDYARNMAGRLDEYYNMDGEFIIYFNKEV